MTKESEVEKTAKSTRNLLIGIIILLLGIAIVVGAYVGIGMYWAWHQEQYAQNLIASLTQKPTPNPTPTTYTIHLERSFPLYNVVTKFEISLTARAIDSPTNITFSSTDILYNGRLGYTYANFAPQITDGIPPFRRSQSEQAIMVRVSKLIYQKELGVLGFQVCPSIL